MIAATFVSAVVLASGAGGPAAPTVIGPRETLNHSVSFTFRSSRASSYRCAVDSTRLHKCTSQPTFGLGLGLHVLRVRAIGSKKRTSPVTLVRVTVYPPAPQLSVKVLWRVKVNPNTQGSNSGSLISVADNRLFVPDPAGNRLVVYDLDGNVVATWGSHGSGPGQFGFLPVPQEPPDTGLAGAGGDPVTGSVYVADTDNHRVQRFSADGTFLAQWGGPGSGPGQFTRVIGVTVAGGVVYAVEDRPLRLGRVQVFDLNGRFLRTFARGQITDSGGGLVVDADGNAVLSDDEANDIKVYDNRGRLVRTFGEFGAIPGQLHFPTGLALIGSTLYIADTKQGRIERFDLPSGRPTGYWDLADPEGVAVDAAGHVYAVDGQENLTKFEVSG